MRELHERIVLELRDLPMPRIVGLKPVARHPPAVMFDAEAESSLAEQYSQRATEPGAVVLYG